MIFYLKVNREKSYVIPNIRHWLDSILVNENRVYLVCDNDHLIDEIKRTLVPIYGDLDFIRSINDSEDIEQILDSISLGVWKKIGRAHLTTFYHARENKYEAFWNIDADDTFFCLSPERIRELINHVAVESTEKKVDLNNLDMWHSVSVSESWGSTPHWSFGVTYTNNKIDWFKIMKAHANDMDYLGMDKLHCNIDWYFTYLSTLSGITIKSFCFRNLKFIHFCSNGFDYPHKGAFYYYRPETIEFPVLKYCFGSCELGEIPIAKDTLHYDIGISDEEAMIALINNSEEKAIFMKEIKNMNLGDFDQIQKNIKSYKDRYNCSSIIVYGAGDYFIKNYHRFRGACEIDMLCDSNSEKWDKVIVDNLVCVRPERILELKNARVIIAVEQAGMSFEILQNLMNMGINSIDHIDNFIKYIVGIR